MVIRELIAMKSKIILSFTALLLVACVRESVQPEENGPKTFDCFTVSMEDSPMTKVHMEDGGAVKWDVGDCIGVYSDMQSPVEFYRNQDGIFRSTNGESVSGTKFYAYNPNWLFSYNSSNPLELRVMSTGNSFTEGQQLWWIPMVAKSDNNHLHFQQIGGVLGFRIKASFPIEMIVVSTNNGEERLNGPCVVGMNKDIPLLQTDGIFGYGTTNATVSDLSFVEGRTVLFSLPVGTRYSGITLEVKGKDPHSGELFTFTKTSHEPLAIERGVIKTYSEIDLDKELGLSVYGKMSLSKDEVVIPKRGGETSVSLTYGGRWTVTSESEWCKVSPSQGSSDEILKIEVEANDGNGDRLATLTVSSLDDDQTLVLAIHQVSDGSTSDWKIRKFAHYSLLMKFTSVHCMYSSLFETYLGEVSPEVMQKCLRVDVYGNKLAADPYSLPDVSRLEDLYILDGYPFGYLDGRTMLANWDDRHYFKEVFEKAVRQQETIYPAASGVSFSSSLSGSTVIVDGTFYAHEPEEYKLSVYLLEDKVNYNSELHDNVLRLSLSDLLGDKITISQKNSTYNFSYSATIPEGCNPDNLFILVVAYRPFGNQPIFRTLYYGDYYVDNCRKSAIGEIVPLDIYGYLDNEGNEGLVPGDEIIF